MGGGFFRIIAKISEMTFGALIKTRELRHTCYTLIAAHFQHSGAADRSSRLAARSTARCSRENTNPSTTN
jgi:hypothetical protein